MWKVVHLINRWRNGVDHHLIAPAVSTFDVIYIGILDEIEHRAMSFLLQREILRTP